jgi:putative copper resistance protein D
VLSLHAEPELPPFTGVSPFTSWEPFQLLTLGLLIVAGLYIWGVLRLTQRGIRWPWHRTVLFVVGGIGAIAFVTIGGIGAYDDTLLSVHMIQHMVLAMLAPICLALGAPVTLALRTLPGRPRAWLVAALHSKIAKVLSFPLLSFGLYVATPFMLYFSGLYRLTLEHEWLHNLNHVHFVVVGCLFFWPLIGLDPLPGRWPYPARALLMVLSTPFHAVLGLTIMQSSTLIAGDWYPNLHLAWANPASDQRVAGGILWGGGEIVSVVMLAALVAQWMRSSEREARRIDRQLDREEARAARAAAARANTSGAAAVDADGVAGAGSGPGVPAEDAVVADEGAADERAADERAAQAERDREAAWSAATGIPMMDDPPPRAPASAGIDRTGTGDDPTGGT